MIMENLKINASENFELEIKTLCPVDNVSCQETTDAEMVTGITISFTISA